MEVTIAARVFEECIKHIYPSCALATCDKEKERDNNWEEETTTYIFDDDSTIVDCNGELSLGLVDLMGAGG